MDFAQPFIRKSYPIHSSNPSPNGIPDNHVHADSNAPCGQRQGFETKIGFTHRKDSLGKSNQFKAPPLAPHCSTRECMSDSDLGRWAPERMSHRSYDLGSWPLTRAVGLLLFADRTRLITRSLQIRFDHRPVILNCTRAARDTPLLKLIYLSAWTKSTSGA